METIIHVQNLKCGICANTLEKENCTIRDIQNILINVIE